jgi:DNA polymerase-1
VYRQGDDLHTRTARNVLGIAEVTAEARRLAKALNFGLLYGMGVNGFSQYARKSYGLNLTEAEARRYRRSFFNAYRGWPRGTPASGPAGRRRPVHWPGAAAFSMTGPRTPNG